MGSISMAGSIPYMTSPGLISKVFEKMQNARRPTRFTQDFLKTKLGYSSGSARPIIPLLKRLGFLGSDGSPTPLYDQFRNENTRAIAIAQGTKNGFSELFDRNEYVYAEPRNQLVQLVVEITGGTKDDSKTKAIVGTFDALRKLADFESDPSSLSADEHKPEPDKVLGLPAQVENHAIPNATDNVDLRVSYTINLNLPETTDPDVFNAIFKALNENLLKN